jgi:hypothetical protein
MLEGSSHRLRLATFRAHQMGFALPKQELQSIPVSA